MYFSNIANPELKHFHHTLGADFTMTLTQILHQTNGEYDNKLFKVEEIITDSLYRIYPLFYCNTVTSSNSNDKVSNSRCLIVLKQTGKETYFSFITDESKSNVIIDETLIPAKTIRDALTVEEFNALVYRLRKYGTLSGTLNYENTVEITGTYATYKFNNTNGQLRNDTGLIINNRLKNNPVTVKLTNPFFVNARYILTFTVRSLTGANVCNNPNDDYKVTDTFTIELIDGVEVPLDLTEYVNDSVLLFDVGVTVSFDVPEIVNNDFLLSLNVDEDSIFIGESIELTATLTGEVVANYSIEFYEDNVLIDTIATDNTGKAVLTDYTPLTTRTHIYTCKFLGLTQTTNVNVSKKPATLTLTSDADSIYVGDTITLTGTLLINGSAISGLTVKLYDNNTFIARLTTDSEGKVEYAEDTLSLGNHSFKLVYEGSDAHESVNSNNSTIIVSKKPTRLTATGNASTLNYGEEYILTGTLLVNNEPISGLRVYLYHNDVLITTLTTDNTGKIEYRSSSLSITEHDFILLYNGSAEHMADITNVKVTIGKIPTSITASLEKRDNQWLVTGYLKDNNNTALSNKQIKSLFYLSNGAIKDVTWTTDDNGRVLPVYMSNYTILKVVLKFAGDDTYVNSSWEAE